MLGHKLMAGTFETLPIILINRDNKEAGDSMLSVVT